MKKVRIDALPEAGSMSYSGMTGKERFDDFCRTGGSKKDILLWIN